MSEQSTTKMTNGIRKRRADADTPTSVPNEPRSQPRLHAKPGESSDDFVSSWGTMVPMWILELLHFWAAFPDYCPVSVSIPGLLLWKYSFYLLQLVHVVESFCAFYVATEMKYSKKVCILWFLQTLSCGIFGWRTLLDRYRRREASPS